MKYYHGCPKCSLEERLSLVKLWTLFCLSMVIVSHKSAGCQFNGFRPHTTTYKGSFNKLRTHLPLDYSLTVMLLDHGHRDPCCVALQEMLSFRYSLSHLVNHSVSPLRDISKAAFNEAKFLDDCPVNKSWGCRSEQWNATHLLQRLEQSMNSFDTNYSKNVCPFEDCTLFTCISVSEKLVLSTSLPLSNKAPPEGLDTLPAVNETSTGSAAMENKTIKSATQTDFTADLGLSQGALLVLLIISVIINAVLVYYLLKKKQQPRPPARAEIEPLSVLVATTGEE
ncbi:uncharacterized protein LOC103189443 [Callorhinchus milii]|uniref:uncharacterized protein LOC103189443 n=1 Tax=Callorhinchus milii TaxID=7868 RepID=UPI00045760A9|nr:uncharacterized protein LOC103189443 [Callorhinchus milii]|eukprot:gi/632982240/ref/XP_007908029.1/ PREDICTED: uncharacterized protein LOC103189443 [Callorhinchus milii]